MAEADPLVSLETLEGVETRNRKSMTFEEMQAFPRREGDLFAEFRDGFTGIVKYEYARREDYIEKMMAHHTKMGVPADFLEDPVTESYLLGFTVIGRATSFRHTDFVQLLDHNLVQLFDMGAAQIWCEFNSEFLNPLRKPQQQAA